MTRRKKIPRNVTQQQIDHAQMEAVEIYQRSSNMTRNEFNHVVAENILEATEENVRGKIAYCRESGDDIRADVMDKYLKSDKEGKA